MAFATFWNFIQELSERPLPPGIDRSMMNSKSGTDQRNLMAVLHGFGLIGPSPNNEVQPALEALANTDKEQRAAELAKLVRHHYPDAVALSETNDTEQKLQQLFREKYGLETPDTRRKAQTFFLHAAQTAGISLSPHFPNTRPGSGAPGTPKAKRSRARKSSGDSASSTPSPTVSSPATSGTEYSTQVKIGAAGVVSLTVNVNPLELSGEDRAFFYDLVDRMNEYRSRTPASPRNDDAATTRDEGGAS
jgi:hypothetical protein